MEFWPTVGAGFVGLVLGAIATTFLGPLLEPWARLTRRIGRTIAREDPVDVLVDTDQALVWAGNPPWVGFMYFFADGLPAEDPPVAGFDWSEWAYRHGGVDVAMSMIQVTIQAKLDVSVVVDTPVARVLERREVPDGVTATYPAGGAELSPRRFSVDLDLFDPPTVDWADIESEPTTSTRPAFKLTAGDVERFQIWIRLERAELVTISIDLPVIINGERKRIRLSGPHGEEFKIIGSSTQVREDFIRSGDAWDHWKDRHPSEAFDSDTDCS